MGARPRSFMGIRRTKRRPNLQRRFCQSSSSASASGFSTVSAKLEALKNLIPAHIDGGGRREIKPDQLFQETADYIVLLRTQISVLQQLVDFYGSDPAATGGQPPQPQQNH